MRLLITTLAPLTTDLSHAPRPVRALADFRTAGHEVYLAAPVATDARQICAALDVQATLPLFPTDLTDWLVLTANAYRVGHWARRWQPDLYLSLDARSAMLAHAGRGATGGYGLSVLVLPVLRYPDHSLGAFLERRAIHECDRLVTHEPALADRLQRQYRARGGDLTLLPGEETAPLVALCERFLAEPPGFR